MIKTLQLPTADLKANDYNPNMMTEDELEELIEEIKHLGRVPKPVVIRRNGNGYEIVDGEHTWKAAQEAELAEVTCELIEADDFEAMRQTYKRNQHGRHHKVKEGRMFARMLEARGLSNRELAAEVELSEGTIRNALLYVAAAERIEAAGRSWELDANYLTVPQLRWFLALPARVALVWIETGADAEALKIARPWDAWRVSGAQDMEATCEKYAQLDELFDWAEWKGEAKGFKTALAAVLKIWDWEDGRLRYWPVSREELRKYSYYFFKKKAFRFEGKIERLEAALDVVIRRGNPYTFTISPEAFGEILEESAGYKESFLDYLRRLRYAVRDAIGELPKDRHYFALAAMDGRLAGPDVPEYIKKSALRSTEAKLALLNVKAGEGYWISEDCTNLEEAKRRVAQRGAIWHEGSPGWTISQAVNWQLVSEIKRMEFEQKTQEMSNLDFAKAVVELLGVYQDEQDAQKRAYMTATLEQLQKQELYVLWNMLRQAAGWMDRAATIKAMSEAMGGTA